MSRWHTLLAIDFDKWAAATYRANFPGVRVECGAVADWIDRLPDADVIVGGPPCQPHSHAGKRMASKDSRDCGPDFINSVSKKKPRQFLMENVPGLLSSEGGRYWQSLYVTMEDAGYVCQYRVQDAVSFGVPQFRERLWVWGIRKDLYAAGVRHCWPVPTHAWPPPETPCMFGAALLPGVTVRQALGLNGQLHRRRGSGMIERHGERRDVPTDEPCITIDGGVQRRILFYDHGVCIPDRPAVTVKAGGNYDASGKQGGGCPPVLAYRWSDEFRAKHPPIVPDEPCQTVQSQWHKGEPNGCLLVEDKPVVKIRRLTPEECLRLQSAPDDFRWPDGISKTNKYKVVGNGWASGHGAKFAEALAAADPDSRTLIDLFCGGGLGACGWHGRYWSYRPEVEAVA